MVFFKKKYKSGRDGLSDETMTQGARLITAAEPKNPVSEQFRTVRTNIDFASVAKGGLQTLLVSSALPSEGKSTITANLAVISAQQGKRVLLVDADLRRPTVATTFGITDNHGLTNYLADSNSDIASIIHHTRMATLDVIIPKIGTKGAAIAAAVSYVFFCFSRTWFSRKCGFKVSFKKQVINIIIFLLAAFVNLSNNPSVFCITVGLFILSVMTQSTTISRIIDIAKNPGEWNFN